MKLNWITAHRRLLKLVWPFVLTVALQVALGVFSLNILSAVRAYVGGESLWSKGQKDAIYARRSQTPSATESMFNRMP